jgi:hypothetical protein
MTKVVFTGTTAECLRHFAARFWDGSTREIWQQRKAISEIFGLSSSAVNEWFSKGHLPVGENKVRLQSFLKLVGYEATDYVPLDPPLDDLAFVIVTRAATIDEVASVLMVRRDQVFEYLLRGGGLSAEREQTLRQFISARRQEWSERLMALKAKVEDLGFVTKAKAPESAAKPAETNGGIATAPEVMLLAQLVNAAAPLAERVASDEFSADDRKLLRQLTRMATGQSNHVFELSNSLNRCCGERARAQLDSQAKV